MDRHGTHTLNDPNDERATLPAGETPIGAIREDS